MGISLTCIGLVALAAWGLSASTPSLGFSRNTELSFLEGAWTVGQEKGLLWPDNPRFGFAHESDTFSQLISDRVKPGYWSEGAIQDLSRFILLKSEEFRISPFLILSLIDVESRYHPQAISSRGAVGLMQLLPATAEEVAVSSGLPWNPALLTNPKVNIDLGLRYMAKLKRQFGSEERALTAYNIGPQALREKLNQGEGFSLDYFNRVKSRMLDYRQKARLSRAQKRVWTKAWL